ncbi:MAG TPA: ATP-binding protein [Gammaproteobacteria bacterium]|jgi:two-component system sensor histidine kinase QseC|nr:ATP-binding protein [Gammaproteobacteria bacterium]
MIKSIKYFLLISLLLSITIASAINGIGNYLLDEKVVQPYLDSQMIRTSSLIKILYKYTDINPKIRDELITDLHKSSPIANLKLIFQIYTIKGDLRLSSPENITIPLKNAPEGFSDLNIKNQEWRIYSETDKSMGAKVIVAELYNLRRELGDNIAHSNANILLITYPVFGLLVWLIVSIALRSVTRVTSEISNRASTFLEPVQLTEIPIEIKPLVAELNELFIRLKLAFERNKSFAADAAHELRTPLAALKTHVQVALKADDDADRNKALQKVIESVDRSSHVVAQLLTLSRLGDEERLTDIKPMDLHKLTTEMMAYLAPHALEKDIEIELAPSPSEPIILGSDISIGILIRNIVDNAIRYTPPKGEVKVEIIDTGSQVIFRVTDTGSGIPPDLRERVFERFYRILGTKATGSGLGLAIVSQIAKLHNADISLSTPPNGHGLQFDVAFPKYHA